MLRKTLASLVLGLVALVVLGSAAAPAHAQDVDRYTYYPFYYYPHSYWPNYVKYPDPRKPMQPPPGYMAYPPFLDPDFRYELWHNHRYHRGFHFWLDQF
jgi:hypothetical protein